MTRRPPADRFCKCLPPRRSWPPTAGGPAFAEAAPTSIARLIKESRTVPEAQASVSERMDFISRALLGSQVSRQHLDRRTAAAGAVRRPRRRLRLRHVLRIRARRRDRARLWRIRNGAAHDPLRARQGRLGRTQSLFRRMVPSRRRKRDLRSGRDRRCRHHRQDRATGAIRGGGRCRSSAFRRRALLANGELLANGDIIGFLSRRPNLDFFHTGLVIFDDDGALMLRSAAQSRRRVVDEPLAQFVAANRVQYVTLLRAVEPPAAAARR